MADVLMAIWVGSAVGVVYGSRPGRGRWWNALALICAAIFAFFTGAVVFCS